MQLSTADMTQHNNRFIKNSIRFTYFTLSQLLIYSQFHNYWNCFNKQTNMNIVIFPESFHIT